MSPAPPYRHNETYSAEAQDLLYAFERALVAQPELTLFEMSGKTYRLRIERDELARVVTERGGSPAEETK